MPWLFHRPETIVPEFIAADPPTEESAEVDSGGYHCAWCGDEPDENGSHGLCPTHAADLRRQYDEICVKRGRAR